MDSKTFHFDVSFVSSVPNFTDIPSCSHIRWRISCFFSLPEAEVYSIRVSFNIDGSNQQIVPSQLMSKYLDQNLADLIALTCL